MVIACPYFAFPFMAHMNLEGLCYHSGLCFKPSRNTHYVSCFHLAIGLARIYYSNFCLDRNRAIAET